jgi:hypothetical protein
MKMERQAYTKEVPENGRWVLIYTLVGIKYSEMCICQKRKYKIKEKDKSR